MDKLRKELEKSENILLLGELDRSEKKSLKELEEEGIVEVERAYSIKRKGKKLKWDNNHRRLSLFVVGMLAGAETMLFSIYLAI